MKKQLILSFIIIFLFCISLVLYPHNNEYKVISVLSPIEIQLENNKFKFDNLQTFDKEYSNNNQELTKRFNITEDEAFILGNLGNSWTKNILLNRKVKLQTNDIIYYKFSYYNRLKNSPFCIENNQLTNIKAFERQLNSIRKSKFVIVDLDTDKYYNVSKENAAKIKNFVVVRKTHIKNINNNVEQANTDDIQTRSHKLHPAPSQFVSENLKIFLSDLTKKLKPDRNCNTTICKEILSNINSAQNTIDIAIYGYSSTPRIEDALKNAVSRGVKIRLVYDLDKNGKNIYPDTDKIISIIPDNNNDFKSVIPEAIMHNKFYIFDDKTVITGSANLSHTDMSGFNSNALIVINSKNIANLYKNEFEQMFLGSFHNDKRKSNAAEIEGYTIGFSPQNAVISSIILPKIRNAQKYIYIPAFVITEKNIIKELIAAKNRGVDVKVIIDALSASVKHSGHSQLRKAGIPVKTENYAGKMHSKSMIIDDKYLIIGSMNFSNSGNNKNDENVILFENPEAAKFYKNFFLYQWSQIPDKWLKFNARAEGKDSIGSCSDGIDNNYDGYTDLEDVRCK